MRCFSHTQVPRPPENSPTHRDTAKLELNVAPTNDEATSIREPCLKLALTENASTYRWDRCLTGKLIVSPWRLR